MKNKRKHNEYCISKGISPRVCYETNQWMDEPAKESVGCTHREQRHGTVDCLKWAMKKPTEAGERYSACQAHREADRKADRCNSESLKE